jgi:hypothetical protein
MGALDTAAMAALILSWSGASGQSTMMMPSLPTASAMLPPRPYRVMRKPHTLQELFAPP